MSGSIDCIYCILISVWPRRYGNTKIVDYENNQCMKKVRVNRKTFLVNWYFSSCWRTLGEVRVKRVLAGVRRGEYLKLPTKCVVTFMRTNLLILRYQDSNLPRPVLIRDHLCGVLRTKGMNLITFGVWAYFGGISNPHTLLTPPPPGLLATCSNTKFQFYV